MPEWFKPILYAKIALAALGGFALLGGICAQTFGSAGRFRFFKGMWAGVLVFISIIMVVVIVTAVLIYANVLYPEYWH